VNIPINSGITSRSPEETIRFGKALGKLLKRGDVVALTGNLGAGKTILTKGIATGLGFDNPGAVTSPTYKILNQYKGRLNINHFDAYRLAGPGDFIDTGGEDLLGGNAVSIIEWAERIEESLPDEKIALHIRIVSDTVRKIEAVLPEGRPELVSLFADTQDDSMCGG